MIDLARQLPLLITRCANMLTYSFFDGKQGDISRNVNISVRCIFLFFRTQFVSWFQRFLLVSWKISTVKRMIFFCNVTEKLSRYKNIYSKTHDFKTLAVLFWLISNFMLFFILWYEKISYMYIQSFYIVIKNVKHFISAYNVHVFITSANTFLELRDSKNRKKKSWTFHMVRKRIWTLFNKFSKY